MIINHNLGSMNAQRNMGINSSNASKSMEKLSSGLRINKAGDDAAGLAISEKMRGQIRGLDQASANAQDGISMIQTGEGALNETTSILQRMRELAVQGSNDTNTTDDRTQIQKEMNQLTSEVSRIGNNTEFNTQKLLNGTSGAVTGGTIITGTPEALGEMTTAVDASADVTIDGNVFTFVTTPADTTTEFSTMAELATAINTNAATQNLYTASDATGGNLKLVQGTGTGSATLATITDTTGDLTVAFDSGKDAAAAVAAITILDTATSSVSGERAKLGAYSNRLDHTIANLGTSSENLTSAESRIRDVDMAKEMS